ncbi:hypothetical protein [Martelella mediterranea]|uniref:Uncharacterized protein n=1 Tax=Martelella mediterranea TaxID=293089 RepID=A0A4R3NM75_9HYPH|nr:hypothetical protein [Martelella mediterranea]TCT35361.1 hypothetical protein EDC90_102616 [Martelella mediterranea]
MSDEKKTQSGAAQGHQSTDSVFDFLYYDAHRVGSFLSQFDDFGHLQALSRHESAGRGKSEIGRVSGSGGVPGIVKGGGHHETGTSAGYHQEAQHTYDPYWSNALSLLDYLQDRNMLDREVKTARIGQIVLFSGGLSVRDLGLIQNAMKLPSVSALISSGGQENESRQVRRRKEKKPSSEPSAEAFGLELLGLLPHGVQMELQSGDKSFWASLREDGLVVSSSDLFLKHGVTLPGEWFVLGILDAIPGIDDEESFVAGDTSAQNASQSREPSYPSAIEQSVFAALIDQLVPAAKTLLGRRGDQYGVTPLMIFRQVSNQR